MGLIDRIIAYPFYQHALLAGFAISIACSLLSVFVVLRRMAFIGQGISHAAFGGAGLAIFLGYYVSGLGSGLYRDVVMATFCVLVGIIIGKVSRGKKIAEDSITGISLVAAMALGMLLLDLRVTLGHGGPAVDLHALLFGSILAIRPSEIWIGFGLAGIVAAAVLVSFKGLVFFSFDEEAAEVFGVPVRILYYGLLIALALTIVLAMRLVGVVLASALLIVPGATAVLLSRRIVKVVLLSLLVGVGCTLGGLIMAIWLRDVSSGASIVVVLCAVFALAYLWNRLKISRFFS
jgi:ABC-type Mn2+/Zn2+ transport system permease subunit